MSVTLVAPPTRPVSDWVTGFVLAAVVVAYLWATLGEPRGRLVLAVVARQDLVGRHQFQADDVEMAMVRVRDGEQWLHAPALTAGRFVQPGPAPGPARVMIRAGEPIYASQMATRFPLPAQEVGLAVTAPSTTAGSVPHAKLRPEDRVALYIASPPSKPPEEGKPAVDPPLSLAAGAVRVLGVEGSGENARPVLWLTGGDAEDLVRRLLTPSAKILLIKR